MFGLNRLFQRFHQNILFEDLKLFEIDLSWGAFDSGHDHLKMLLGTGPYIFCTLRIIQQNGTLMSSRLRYNSVVHFLCRRAYKFIISILSKLSIAESNHISYFRGM